MRRLNMNRRTLAVVFVATLALLYGTLAMGAESPYGGGTQYRNLFDPEGPYGWLTPRVLIWILAQLHLLFAAFVLAVPMFALIIEIVGVVSKDPEQSQRYDDLAHEFTRLLTTAFSITSILGAIFTFLCIGLYPGMFNYLVEVFGPSMYLYACIFFGESFSLYLYYYGWGKIRGWTHVMLGVVLNAFGITLMLIANAWTTFMMAPAGLDEAGAVVDRHAAFFNFLLHPINIHRLIANLCMGGSVAAAYAAYKFLKAKTDEERAHYDWMGYIGNFIAVLALLPLPFAGYYLGYEIYAFNQQLGIYMMGGVLSWLFVMQAVLVGALFFAANYYLWLGMDRIEGSERYRGWIKFMLGIITVCILVWATPNSLILSSSEIQEMGGTKHPILSLLGVMSAKNTAVNLIILTTFLSFVLYRRGNKEPTVSWAKAGNAVQALAFGAAAAVVIFIGVGGYIDSLWLESEKRVGMSPYQVLAVLAAIAVVLPIDLAMFRNAREIGQIRWGQVSKRSQYCLFFLAVSFTWLMALMGFVRSSLRQHWHVYEVLEDTSASAFTPSIGYATMIVSIVVVIFFLLVSVVVYISQLGAHDDEHAEGLEEDGDSGLTPGRFAAAVAAFFIVLWCLPDASVKKAGDPWEGLPDAPEVGEYGVVSADAGTYRVPVGDMLKQMAEDPTLLAPAVKAKSATADMSPEERGAVVFEAKACGACHSVAGEKMIGPALDGLFGKEEKLVDGSMALVDEAYLVESILDPNAKVVDGFGPVMTPFAGMVTDREVDDLVAYIKSLAD